MREQDETKLPADAGPVQRTVGRLEPERGKLWRVVRYIREEFEVEASSRDEALAAANDPHTVIVTRETCVLSGGAQ